MKNIKELQMITVISGFLLVACLVIFGGYASINKSKSPTLTKTPALSNKVVAKPDSTNNLH